MCSAETALKTAVSRLANDLRTPVGDLRFVQLPRTELVIVPAVRGRGSVERYLAHRCHLVVASLLHGRIVDVDATTGLILSVTNAGSDAWMAQDASGESFYHGSVTVAAQAMLTFRGTRCGCGRLWCRLST